MGQKAAMRSRSSFAPARRRKSPLPMILLTLLILLIGFFIYAATVSTEVPTQRMEQDVTNAALAG